MHEHLKAAARHNRMRQALDTAIQKKFGLSWGDWDDEERSRANSFLRELTLTGNESAATKLFIGNVISWLAEKYGLVDIRDTGWPDIRNPNNS